MKNEPEETGKAEASDDEGPDDLKQALPETIQSEEAGGDIGNFQPEEYEDLQLFVGSDAEYYLEKWKYGPKGFNLRAFVFSGFWLPYRKMWKETCLFYGVLLLVAITEAAANVEIGLGRVGFLLAIACGACGNGWYLSHARRMISKVRAGYQDPLGQLTIPPETLVKEILPQRGGVSFVFGVRCVICFAVIVRVLDFLPS